ncbi:MAG: FxsA family protein [Gemmatimonadota bacterium]|nr:FxsA family protein [Gemmatimonadota bacterium]
MLLRLFLLFTLIPVAELWLLIKIGGAIGAGPTLGLVIATGAAGAWLARREGLKSWLAVQSELATGRVPGQELVHGVLILIAGVVLLTPGVITDAIGLSLLIRPVRKALISRFRARFEKQLGTGATGFVGGPGFGVFWGGPDGPGGMRAGGPFDEPTRRGRDFGGEYGGDAPEGRRTTIPRGREILVDEDPE